MIGMGVSRIGFFVAKVTAIGVTPSIGQHAILRAAQPTGVIARESGRSSTPQRIDRAQSEFNASSRGYWIARVRGQ